MASYLITGCSRGLGLELASQLLQLPASEVAIIFVTARKETPAITELANQYTGRVIFVSLDVTDDGSIKSAVKKVTEKLQDKGLDVLVNNAGIMLDSPGGIEKMNNLTDHYAIHVLGTQNVTAGFLPLLRKGNQKKIMNVSTTLGSIALAKSFGTAQPAYKITKAALNMLTVQWSETLAPEGFTVFLISPGWLKTELGSSYADLDVSVGAKCVVEALLNATPKDNKRYMNIKVAGWENGKSGAKEGEAGPNIYDGVDAPW